MPAHAHDLSDVSRSLDRSARKIVLRDSTLRHGDNLPVDVRVTDLSTTGFSVEAALDLKIGAIVGLGLGGAGTASARIIRRAQSTYGAQFLRPLDPDRVEAAFKYSEILGSIGGSAAIARVEDYAAAHRADAYRAGEPDKLSRRTRLAIMLTAGSLAWGAVALVWLVV